MSKNGTQKPDTIPAAVSRTRYAQLVLAQLAQIQEQRAELELVMLSNDHAETDPVPGLPPKTNERGEIVYEGEIPVVPSYGERLAELAASEARVWGHAEKNGAERLVRALAARTEAEAEIQEAQAQEE